MSPMWSPSDDAIGAFNAAVARIQQERAEVGRSDDVMCYAGALLVAQATDGKDFWLVYSALLYEEGGVGSCLMPAHSRGKLLLFASYIARLQIGLIHEHDRQQLRNAAHEIATVIASKCHGVSPFLDAEFRRLCRQLNND